MLLARFIAPLRRPRGTDTRLRYRPRLERLEERCLLAGLAVTDATMAPETIVPSAFANPPVFSPSDITAGPDGNLWFTDTGPSEIGLVPPNNPSAIHEYPLPSGSYPTYITAGPHGNLWFTEAGTSKIGEMTPQGQLVSETSFNSQSSPAGIAADGNQIWFTENGSNQIGVLDVSSPTPQSSYPLTEIPITQGNQPGGITVGADGNVWFGELGYLGEVNPATLQIVAYHALDNVNATATTITAGPNRTLWYSEYDSQNGNSIGEFSLATNTVVTNVPLPDPQIQAGGVTPAPDGNIWFTEAYDPQRNLQDGSGQFLGELDPQTSIITEVPTRTPRSAPTGITIGPDGNLWFAEQNSGEIGEAVLPQVPSPLAGNSATFDMGSFMDTSSDNVTWTGSVAWGDQTFSPLANPNDPNAPITPGPLASADHRYAAAGTYTVTVSVTNSLNDTASRTFEVRVNAQNPTLHAPRVIQATPGQSTNLHLTGLDPNDSDPNGLTATIDWGDQSTPTTQALNPQDDTYDVQVTHLYASPGVYYVTTVVARSDGGRAVAYTKVTAQTGLVGNGLIAFTSTQGGFDDIWTGAVDSTINTQLTHNGSSTVHNLDPVWSPDGSEIAFASTQDDPNHTQIYIMRADGSHVQRLTTDAANDSAPAWSPDGTDLIFVSDRSGSPQLWEMSALSGDTAQAPAVALTNLKGYCGAPTWSGNRVAFQFQQPGAQAQILVLTLSGSGSAAPQPLTPLSGLGNNTDPAWSPDGSELAFSSDRFGTPQIFVMSAGGGPAADLSNNHFSDTAPAWSPDGTALVFARTGNVVGTSNARFYTMSMTGTGQAPLTLSTSDAANATASWQPVQRPLNDDISAATAFSPAQWQSYDYVTGRVSGTLHGSNVNASKRVGDFITAERNEPNHAGNIGGKSVWYVWTSPWDGVTDLDTRGSVFTTLGSDNRTLLAVYTLDPATGALDAVQNTSGGIAQMVGGSTVPFATQAGVHYYIAIDGANDALGGGAASGTIQLNWSFIKQRIIPAATVSAITPAQVPLDSSWGLSSNHPDGLTVTVSLTGANFTLSSSVFVSVPSLAGIAPQWAAPQALGRVLQVSSTATSTTLQWQWHISPATVSAALQGAAILGLSAVPFQLSVGMPAANHSNCATLQFTLVPELDSITPQAVATTYVLHGSNFTDSSKLYWAPGNQPYQQITTGVNVVSATEIDWTPDVTLGETQHLFVSNSTYTPQTPGTDPGQVLALPAPVDPQTQQLGVQVANLALGGLFNDLVNAAAGIHRYSLEGLGISRADLTLNDPAVANLVSGAQVVPNDIATVVKRDFAGLYGPNGAVGFMRLDQDGGTFYQGDASASGQLSMVGLTLMLQSEGYYSEQTGAYSLLLENTGADHTVFAELRLLNGAIALIDWIDPTQTFGVVQGLVPPGAPSYEIVATLFDTAGTAPLTAGQIAAELNVQSEITIAQVQINAAGNTNLVGEGGNSLQDVADVVSHDGGTLIATGGGNLVATGGGNVVATGGGNVISNEGGSFGYLQAVDAGGNLVAQGGGNLVAQGGGNLVSVKLISNVVSHDGGTFGSVLLSGGGQIISNEGGSLQAGAFVAAMGDLAPVGTLVLGSDNRPQTTPPASLSQIEWSELIGADGCSIVSERGNGLVSTNGGNFVDLVGSFDASLGKFALSDAAVAAILSEHGAG